MTFQEGDRQGAFEVCDASTERRLRNIQSRRRTLEAFCQGDLGKIANLPDVHGAARGMSIRHR